MSNEFQNPMVTIELVALASYTTLRQTFRRGEACAVSREQWAELQNEVHPTNGKPLFALTKKRGQRPESIASEMLEGTGIVITHNTPDGTKNGNVAGERGTDKPGPNDMSTADLRRAGLVGDIDTGAGVTIEEDLSGPSGHEGLDLEEEDAVQLRGTAQEPVEASDEVDGPQGTDAASEEQEEAAAAPVAPVAKRAGPKVVRPGPRNAALKDKLPTKVTPPASAGDEVPV